MLDTARPDTARMPFPLHFRGFRVVDDCPVTLKKILYFFFQVIEIDGITLFNQFVNSSKVHQTMLPDNAIVINCNDHVLAGTGTRTSLLAVVRLRLVLIMRLGVSVGLDLLLEAREDRPPLRGAYREACSQLDQRSTVSRTQLTHGVTPSKKKGPPFLRRRA